MTDETPLATSRRTLLAGMAFMAAAGTLSSRAKAGGDMKHVVLLGDSIFDNKRYVGEEPDVIDQLKADLPAGWTASAECARRLDHFRHGWPAQAPPPRRHPSRGERRRQRCAQAQRPARREGELGRRACSTSSARSEAEFQANYRAMLDRPARGEAARRGLHHLRGALQNPDTHRIAATGLSVFNDIITREAFARGLPLIDLG